MAGGPIVPPWLQAKWQARGAKLTVWVDTSPKARHGRLERRELWALADPELNRYVGSAGVVGEAWPYLQQVCRVVRQRRIKGQTALEVSYAITSLPPLEAEAKRLLTLSREYWGIENRLHWVRDVSMDEDRCQVRSGAAPQALAACRNLALALLRRSKVSNIAAALRTYAGRPHLAVALVLCAGQK